MKLFGIINLLIVAMLATAPASAGDKNKTVESITVSATAATEEKAISKALAQAIQQVNGVQVEVNTQMEEAGQQLIIDWFGNKTILEGQDINKGFTNIRASGPVRSYRVISSELLSEQKLWKVTLEASINKYKNLGEDRSNLTQLAILPFRPAQTGFATVDGMMAANTIAASFSTLLTDSFVQSQRFRVLDRSFWHEAAGEALIIQNFSSATHESVKQGQKLGADYILVGILNKFDVARKQKKSYGSTTNRYEAEFDLSLRVIEVATSDIIWSETINRKFDRKELREKLQTLQGNALERSEQEAAAEMQAGLYAIIASEVSKRVINHFYPVKAPGAGAVEEKNMDIDKAERPARPLTPGSSEEPIKWQ